MWVSDGGVGLQKERWRGKRLSCAHLQRFRLSPRTAPFGSGNCCSPPGLASAGSMAQPPRPVWLCCCCWSSCLPAPAPASGGVATLRCPALPLGSPQLGSPLRSMPCPLAFTPEPRQCPGWSAYYVHVLWGLSLGCSICLPSGRLLALEDSAFLPACPNWIRPGSGRGRSTSLLSFLIYKVDLQFSTYEVILGIK